MSESLFSWSYDEQFQTIFHSSTVTISLCSNSLLLYIIFTTRSSSIGCYRYLLAVFAACDIVTSFSHIVLQPIMYMASGGIYLIPRHGPIMIGGQSFDKIFALVFVATFFQTFLILTYHFVYRFKAMARAIKRSFTEKWTRSQWILLGVVINVLFISVIVSIYAIAFCCDDVTRDLAYQTIMDAYGIDLQVRRRCFLQIVALRPDPSTADGMAYHRPAVLGLAILLLMLCATGSVIIYCIWRINGMISATDNQLSAKTREMQLDLYRALLVQTAVPMLISYLPSAVMFLFPALSSMALGTFGNVLYLPTSIFPSIDAFFILFFIRRFRTATIRMFRISFTSNSVSQSNTFDNRN